MYQPIRNRIAGLQLRALNQGRMPFGIQPGFEGPAPKTCQYIAGRPSADDTCKCGRPSLPRSAYCAEHHARCWTTEEAAQGF